MKTSHSRPEEECPRCKRPLRSSSEGAKCWHCLMRLGLNTEPLNDEQHASNDSGIIRTFKDYELIDEIARGGMGVVYRAHQKSLNREVAIKLVLGGPLATPEMIRRFKIEAEAAARLDHPGIVPIYEIGECDSQHFFSMKLIKGSNLQGSLSRFQLSKGFSQQQCRETHRKIASLMLKITDSVNYAHEHGVLHRDLKPTNVLLEPNGDPRVTDFGLAKLVDANQDEITLSTTVLGSPAHMSPEQAKGEVENITTATDIYGVGAILYGLLTGRPPFQGSSTLEVIRAVAEDEPEPPRRINSRVNRDLETIALKCLEKKPSNRYSSVAELSQELQRFMNGVPIVALPISSLERFTRYCRRNPIVSSLLTLLVITTITGMIGIAYQWQNAVTERRRADRNANQAIRQRNTARWEAYRSQIALAANAVGLNQNSVAGDALKASPEEFREWEWHFLNSQLEVALVRYEKSFSNAPSKLWFNEDGTKICCVRSADFVGGGHQTTVWDTFTKKTVLTAPYDGMLSHDFSKLAYSESGSVVIRDLKSNRSRKITHQKSVLSHLVAFDSDNKFLATRSKSGLHVWDIAADEEALFFPGKPDAFFGERFWDIGNQHFLFQGGNELKCFDSKTHRIIRVQSLAGGEVHTITSNVQSRLIAMSREYPNNVAELWDADTGELRARLIGHRNVVFRMKFSPDGKLLATGSPDKSVRIWDSATGQQLLLCDGHQDDISDLAFDREGKRLASSSLDGTIRIWNSETGQQLGSVATVHNHKIAFHPNGNSIASTGLDGIVYQWEFDSQKKRQWTGHTGFVYGIDLHPTEKNAASTGWDKSVKIWDVESGVLNKSISIKDIGLGVRFSSDGNFLAVTTPKHLRVFRAESLELMSKVGILSYNIGTLAGVRPGFSPDSRLVACGFDNVPILARTKTGVIEARLERHNGTVTDCVFIRDGKQLISVGGSLVRFHNVNTHSLQSTYEVQGSILSLGLNSSRTKYCISTAKNVVYLFDISQPNEPLAILKHTSTPYSMAFSNNDERLFVGCHDGTVRVWDLAKYEPVVTLHGHSDYVHSIAIDSSNTLFTGSGDNTIRVWKSK